jgi:hypothetical protein
MSGPVIGLNARLCNLDKRFPAFERCNDRREFDCETAQQFGPSRISDPNPDDRRALVQNPVDSEVFVLRDDHGSSFSGVRADRVVGRLSAPRIGNVLGQVAERFNLSREGGWKLSVDEEAQSCAPQDRMIVLPGGELQNCRDVVGFEVRIVRKDFFPRCPSGEKIEHVPHANAEATNTRAATANIRRHSDSVHRAHIGSKASALRYSHCSSSGGNSRGLPIE